MKGECQRQLTFGEVNYPCPECKMLDMDDQVPERCAVADLIKYIKPGMGISLNPRWRCDDP
jgi:hypothetical protein